MKKLIKRYSSGGGGSVQQIPSWAAPYIKDVMGTTASAYRDGALDNVAGTNTNLDTAFKSGGDAITAAAGQGGDYLADQASRLNNMAIAPSEDVLAAKKAEILYNAQKGVAGLNTSFGANGTLGSGRQAVMQGAQNADTVGRIAQVDSDYEQAMFKNRLSAEEALKGSVGANSDLASSSASSLTKLGSEQRSIDQQGLDADWQGLQRYASTIYGNPARQTSSGGK